MQPSVNPILIQPALIESINPYVGMSVCLSPTPLTGATTRLIAYFRTAKYLNIVLFLFK